MNEVVSKAQRLKKSQLMKRMGKKIARSRAIKAKRMADAGLVVIVSAPQNDYLYALESCTSCAISVITDNDEWTLPEGCTQFSSVKEALVHIG